MMRIASVTSSEPNRLRSLVLICFSFTASVMPSLMRKYRCCRRCGTAPVVTMIEGSSCLSLQIAAMRSWSPAPSYSHHAHCQSALEWDPLSASKRDPFDRRVLMVALAASELAGVVETARARVVVDRHHRANSVRCRGRHFEQREVVAQHPRDRSTGRKPDRPKPCRGSPHAFS